MECNVSLYRRMLETEDNIRSVDNTETKAHSDNLSVYYDWFLSIEMSMVNTRALLAYLNDH